jgi:hypothetical protein
MIRKFEASLNRPQKQTIGQKCDLDLSEENPCREKAK